MRVAVRSRTGNVVIGLLGAVYALAGTVLLVYAVVDTWGANGTIDRLVQTLLVATIVAGGWFIALAARTFGVEFHLPYHPHRNAHTISAASASSNRA